MQDTPDQTEIPLDINPRELEMIVKWAEAHNYAPPRVETPLKTGDVQKNMSEIDYKFVMEHKLNHENVKTLLEKCHYMQIQYLESVCICLIASHFFVGNEVDSIPKKMKELGVTEDLTVRRHI